MFDKHRLVIVQLLLFCLLTGCSARNSASDRIVAKELLQTPTTHYNYSIYEEMKLGVRIALPSDWERMHEGNRITIVDNAESATFFKQTNDNIFIIQLTKIPGKYMGTFKNDLVTALEFKAGHNYRFISNDNKFLVGGIPSYYQSYSFTDPNGINFYGVYTITEQKNGEGLFVNFFGLKKYPEQLDDLIEIIIPSIHFMEN